MVFRQEALSCSFSAVRISIEGRGKIERGSYMIGDLNLATFEKFAKLPN